ncbi:MAG TPA: PAS domain S-box protein, partial [Candidatus Wallbacteria bacterium]|nr:PAS domain S-box protein [Candidatus Wallbacteria bacterium]
METKGLSKQELITELEKTFKEVKFCRTLLKNILDTISIGVSYEDRRGCVIIENMASRKIWENIRSISESQTFKHHDYLTYIGKFGNGSHETIMPDARGIFEDTIEIECLDGRLKTIHCSVSNIFNESNEPIGSILVSQDITEQRKAKETIENSEKKFRELIELANDGYWVIDKNMLTVFVNRRLSEILGYAPEEIIGKKPSDFMEDKSKNDFLADHAETVEVEKNNFERIFIHKSGKK